MLSSVAAPNERLFAAVNQELARLVGAYAAALLRFEPDDTITLLAAWNAAGAPLAVGDQQPVNAALRRLRDSARPVRCGPADVPLTGPFIAEIRQFGIRATVAVPILLDGRVWGVSVAASQSPEPFPAATEARMVEFAELLATAISHAQARAVVEELAEQQTALRRVATLVARGAPPDEVFAAVTAEVARLLVAEETVMARYDPDGTFTILSSSGKLWSVGRRYPLGGKNVATLVFETARPARV